MVAVPRRPPTGRGRFALPVAALLVAAAVGATAAEPAAAARLVLDDHASARVGCFDPELWVLKVDGNANARCAGSGDAIELTASAQGGSACDPASSAVGLETFSTFGPGSVAVVRTSGHDLAYATTAMFGWAPAAWRCDPARNGWDNEDAIIVTTNAFPPQRDSQVSGLRVITNGVSRGALVHVDESVPHDYRLVWLPERVEVWVDGSLAAAIDGETPARLMPFAIGATAWATSGGPVTQTFYDTLVAPASVVDDGHARLLDVVRAEHDATRARIAADHAEATMRAPLEVSIEEKVPDAGELFALVTLDGRPVNGAGFRATIDGAPFDRVAIVERGSGLYEIAIAPTDLPAGVHALGLEVSRDEHVGSALAKVRGVGDVAAARAAIAAAIGDSTTPPTEPEATFEIVLLERTVRIDPIHAGTPAFDASLVSVHAGPSSGGGSMMQVAVAGQPFTLTFPTAWAAPAPVSARLLELDEFDLAEIEGASVAIVVGYRFADAAASCVSVVDDRCALALPIPSSGAGWFAGGGMRAVLFVRASVTLADAGESWEQSVEIPIVGQLAGAASGG